MVRVADVGEIDGLGRELGGILTAHDALDVLDPVRLGLLLDVLDELFGNIDGVNLPLGAHGFGKHPREEAGARADVRHAHPRPDFAGLEDLLAVVVSIPALPLKPADEVADVRVLEGFVDPRVHALLLSRHRPRDQKEGENNPILHGETP